MIGGSRRAQCYGKIRHKNYAKARKAQREMGNTQTGRLNVYKCPWCNGFHVGKVENRNGRKSR